MPASGTTLFGGSGQIQTLSFKQGPLRKPAFALVAGQLVIWSPTAGRRPALAPPQAV